VHRDVKPGNLLVRPNGTLVLTDFGIARSAMVGQLTQVGSVLGTASYISPEQAAGGQASPLSDVYALGVVAYQCLAGRRPFEGDNPLEIAMKHVRTPPPPLPPDIPPSVRTVVDRAMAKDPAARFPTAAALGQVARRSANGLSSGGTTRVSPAGAPISVPPVASQTSPGIVGAATSTGNRLPGAVPGGTRRMPAYPGDPMNRTAATQVSPPGYGRAAPPAPPRHPDTGHLPPAGPPQPEQRRRGNGPIIAIVVVLVILLLLIGLVFWLQGGGGNGSSGTGGGPQNTTSDTGQPSAAAPPVGGGQSSNDVRTIDCADMQSRKADTVERSLRQKGFTNVHRAPVPGGKSDTVQSVTPCQAAPNDPITVNVYTGKSATPTGGPPTDNCIQLPILGGNCPTSTRTNTPSGGASPSSTPKN
jgi:serine/threonine-protein kinase